VFFICFQVLLFFSAHKNGMERRGMEFLCAILAGAFLPPFCYGILSGLCYGINYGVEATGKYINLYQKRSTSLAKKTQPKLKV